MLLEEANVLPETIPEYLIKEYKLMGINEATKANSFPK